MSCWRNRIFPFSYLGNPPTASFFCSYPMILSSNSNKTRHVQCVNGDGGLQFSHPSVNVQFLMFHRVTFQLHIPSNQTVANIVREKEKITKYQTFNLAWPRLLTSNANFAKITESIVVLAQKKNTERRKKQFSRWFFLKKTIIFSAGALSMMQWSFTLCDLSGSQIITLTVSVADSFILGLCIHAIWHPRPAGAISQLVDLHVCRVRLLKGITENQVLQLFTHSDAWIKISKATLLVYRSWNLQNSCEQFLGAVNMFCGSFLFSAVAGFSSKRMFQNGSSSALVPDVKEGLRKHWQISMKQMCFVFESVMNFSPKCQKARNLTHPTRNFRNSKETLSAKTHSRWLLRSIHSFVTLDHIDTCVVFLGYNERFPKELYFGPPSHRKPWILQNAAWVAYRVRWRYPSPYKPSIWVEPITWTLIIHQLSTPRLIPASLTHYPFGRSFPGQECF